MRRLVIELYGKKLEKWMEGSSQGMESMETVHILRRDRKEFVAILRVRLKDPSSKIEDCFKNDGVTKEVQVLEHEEKHQGEEASSYLVLLRRKATPGSLLGRGTATLEGAYMYGPVSFMNGRLRFTFVGTQKQVRILLEGAEERGLQYRVVSITDADFAEDSLLNRLTDKQRRTLLLAYKLGYFDVPKKINSDQLGERLHLSGSTVVEHLNKAENRLLTGIIGET